MAYDDLGDFLSRLEDDRELVRIAAEVDPVHELAEITARIARAPDGGPAVLFESVAGSEFPVVANLLGCPARLCRLMNAASFDEVAERLAARLKPDVSGSWLDALKMVPQLGRMASAPPRLVKTGACQQVVEMGRDVDLRRLPVPHAWPGESARTITAGQVVTRDPETGGRDVALTPLALRDERSLHVHWDVQQDGWRNFEAHRRGGQQMPVAVALGGDPLLVFAAHAPLPPGADACLLAGLLREKPVELVRCRTAELEVPAAAEIVIEGYVDPAAGLERAGPIAAATGFHSLPEEVPVMHVTAVTRRANPVFPALIRARPPSEEHCLERLAARCLRPFVRMLVPEVVDLHFPPAGAGRNLLFVSVRKRYPHQARKVMNAVWALDALSAAKIVVVVDADADVSDEEEVWFRVGAHAHPGRDVAFWQGATHMADHAAPIRGLGHKLGIDATRKLADEGHSRPWPEELRMSEEVRDRVHRRWGEFGLRVEG
ncbi:MAG: UbiD family decarboxylase [Planctomycetales bacterium]